MCILKIFFPVMAPVKNKLAQNCPMHCLSSWAIIYMFASYENDNAELFTHLIQIYLIFLAFMLPCHWLTWEHLWDQKLAWSWRTYSAWSRYKPKITSTTTSGCSSRSRSSLRNSTLTFNLPTRYSASSG